VKAGRDRDMWGPFGRGERINERRAVVIMEGKPQFGETPARGHQRPHMNPCR
jgi:hypothetical protein